MTYQPYRCSKLSKALKATGKTLPYDIQSLIKKHRTRLDEIRIPQEPMMTEFERQCITVLALEANDGNGVLDYGTWRGATTSCLAQAIDPAKVWTINIVENVASSPDWTPENEIGIHSNQYPNVVQTLIDSLDFVPENVTLHVDLALIDANHHPEYVKHDGESAYRVIRAGGFLVLHNFELEGPAQFVQDHLHYGQWWYIPATDIAFCQIKDD